MNQQKLEAKQKLARQKQDRLWHRVAYKDKVNAVDTQGTHTELHWQAG